MNKYKILIQGMHCSACSTLISMELEEAGAKEIYVDKDQGNATFSTEKEENEVQEMLSTVFKNLDKYSYSNLQKINH